MILPIVRRSRSQSICSCLHHHIDSSISVHRTHKKNYCCSFHSSSDRENDISLLLPENGVSDKSSSPSTICWSTSCSQPQEADLSRSLDFPLFIHCFSSLNFFPLNFHFFSPSPSFLRPFTPSWKYPHPLIFLHFADSVLTGGLISEGLGGQDC